MNLNLNIDPTEYQNKHPFPHTFVDNVLDEKVAAALQKEILDIPMEYFDRYNNPFEQKYTLRDKYNYPPKLNELMNVLTSDEILQKLSNIVGHELHNDPTRNFWGVHIYEPGDKLDIHVDAGFHPTTNDKKQVTLGIYLSYQWKDEYGCELEIWEGDDSQNVDPKLTECITKIVPKFNRLVLFTCEDNSWHGNPNPSTSQEDGRRIFVTLSYLSKNDNYGNRRKKALFIQTPNEPFNEEKKRLAELRSDISKYKDVYRYNESKNNLNSSN